MTKPVPRVLTQYIDMRSELDQLHQARHNVVIHWTCAGKMCQTGRNLLAFYDDIINTQATQLQHIKRTVDNIQDDLIKEIMTAHYLQGITLDELAEQLHYSTTQLNRYRQKAINEFLKYYEEATK